MEFMEADEAKAVAADAAKRLAKQDPVTTEEFCRAVLSLVVERALDPEMTIEDAALAVYDELEPLIGETVGADERDQT